MSRANRNTQEADSDNSLINLAGFLDVLIQIDLANKEN